MQLTRAADYAVRVMIYLAGLPQGAIATKAGLAEATDAPESFLSKILQSLGRAGFIRARRGVEGGFVLLPLGSRSTLLQVVEAINGPIALNVCLASGAPCDRHVHCAAHHVWVRAQEAMLAVLRDAKIRDLAAHGALRPSRFVSIGSAPNESETCSLPGVPKSTAPSDTETINTSGPRPRVKVALAEK